MVLLGEANYSCAFDGERQLVVFTFWGGNQLQFYVLGLKPILGVGVGGEGVWGYLLPKIIMFCFCFVPSSLFFLFFFQPFLLMKRAN